MSTVKNDIISIGYIKLLHQGRSLGWDFKKKRWKIYFQACKIKRRENSTQKRFSLYSMVSFLRLNMNHKFE